jgi:site-specific recombinase XerD
MSKQISPVTNEEWSQINENNKKMVEVYLDSLTTLSNETIKQYTSALKIYFRWIKENETVIPNRLMSLTCGPLYPSIGGL